VVAAFGKVDTVASSSNDEAGSVAEWSVKRVKEPSSAMTAARFPEKEFARSAAREAWPSTCTPASALSAMVFSSTDTSAP
jgi:hypothetical protein